MPIGVPKVPYRLPGEPYSQWVDLYNYLNRERVIFLGKAVDDEIANQIIAVMLYLDAEEPGKDIQLYINSPGGSVSAGLAIYDTMRYLKSGVSTICVGLAASMGSFLLAAGVKGKRLALSHSRIMLHQPSQGATQGQASDIAIAAKEIIRLRHQLNEIYAANTGQTLERIATDTERDFFLSAIEAKEYGLVDQVIEGKGI